MNYHYENYKEKLTQVLNKAKNEILYANHQYHDSLQYIYIKKKIKKQLNKKLKKYKKLQNSVYFLLNYDKQRSDANKTNTPFEIQNKLSKFIKNLEKSMRQNRLIGLIQTEISQELAQQIHDYDSRYKLSEQNILQQDTLLLKK
ncbi:unnamed protein product [Paramecium sonneborni]|uniref:Uncharacterized protein n=1 Tax=Paramecium sonneborni TaxID=65129 RepID=A0A8S1KH39_9CILI|nr:unnamed protein product [Paramecium sonneborni]